MNARILGDISKFREKSHKRDKKSQMRQKVTNGTKSYEWYTKS